MGHDGPTKKRNRNESDSISDKTDATDGEESGSISDSSSTDGEESHITVGNLSLSGLGLELSVRSNQSDVDHGNESVFDALNLNEIREVLLELIQSCEELAEKRGFQANQDKLANHVKQSWVIFEKVSSKKAIRSSAPQQESSNTCSMDDGSEPEDSECNSPMMGDTNGNGDQVLLEAKAKDKTWVSMIHLSLKHTKSCIGLMKNMVEDMGVDEVFNIETYLNSLKSLGMDELGGYSGKKALTEVSTRTDFCMKTFPTFPSMFLFHQEFLETLNSKEVVVAKVKGETVKRMKFGTGTDPIRHVEVNKAQKRKTQMEHPVDDEEHDRIREGLSAACEEKGSEVNIFELTVNKDSIVDTLRNTFGVAFGVREGSIELKKLGGGSVKDQLKYSVLPCPLVQKRRKYDSQNRSQCIVSISAKTLKAMHSLAMGENSIKPS